MAKNAKKALIAKAVGAPKGEVDLLASVTTDAKAIGRMIANIASVQSTQRERVRIAAVCAMEYAIQHGNANFLTSLHEAIGAESRRNDFIKWCLNFGPIRWIEGKTENGSKAMGKFGIDSKRADEYKELLAKDRNALLTPLVKLPYWEYIKEKPFEGITVAQLIQAAVSKIASVRKDADKADHPDNNFEGEEDLIALAAKYPYLKKGKKADAKAATMH